jgi:hypothetical protein
MVQEEYIPQWALNEKKAEQKAAADQFDNGLRELMAAQKKLGIQKLNILTGELGNDRMVAALVPAGAKKAVPYVLFDRAKNELKLVGDQIAPSKEPQTTK